MANTMTILSLGAGVQSTALLMLSAEGVLPKLDAAVFADTGWEPRAVYEHLDRLDEQVAKPAGIPIYRVSSGNIRDDALNPDHRFASMPLFVKNQNGERGITRRQCTSEYKIKPIKEQVRLMLGATRTNDGRVGRVPSGNKAVQWIGISVDEFHRAKSSDVLYVEHQFPLLDLGWTRDHCTNYLERRGWGSTPKSACIGCPFHGNHQWRALRDNYPDEFANAVEFDAAIRNGSARANAQGMRLRGEMFLHSSLVPLSEAPIDHVTSAESRKANATMDLFTDSEVEFTCSPFACRADELPMYDYVVEPDYETMPQAAALVGVETEVPSVVAGG